MLQSTLWSSKVLPRIARISGRLPSRERCLAEKCCCPGELREAGALGLHLALRVGIVVRQQNSKVVRRLG